MQDFEEKLNTLLSDPKAMEQVAQLAKSLSGAEPSAEPPQSSPSGDPVSALGSLLGSIDPALVGRLPLLLRAWNRPQSGETLAFLNAMRPFLKEDKRGKVARAAQLARIIHLAKLYFSQEG